MLEHLIKDDGLNPENATNQFLTFILGDEEYGLDILRIQEIKGWGSVTKIPNMPEYILGVINLRGTIVPIMDLRKRFNLSKVEYDAMTVVIVAKVYDEDHERVVGLVVDAVSEVYDLNDKCMQPPPEFGCNIQADFIYSLANVEEKMIILMDIDKLVSQEIRQQLTEAKNTHQSKSEDS